MKAVVGGRLKFKGDSSGGAAAKPKRKRDEGSSISGGSSSKAVDAPGAAEELHDVTVQAGIGRFTSSGTTIHGFDTVFMDQLSVGDAIIISHPTSLCEETKVVRMVLSNVSISVSSPFSTDLISTTAFSFVKAPKTTKEEVAAQDQRKRERLHNDEKTAVGTYASDGGTQFVYRVKSAGGYKIIKESTGGHVTRGELLDMRSKKKADRHCY